MHTAVSESGSFDVVLAKIAKRLAVISGADLIHQALLGAGSSSGFSRIAKVGGILMQAGLVEEAEEVYIAGERLFPGYAGPFAGLAQVAMRRKDWPKALELWDHALGVANYPVNVGWLSARSVVLFELGRRREAEEGLATLAADFSDQPAGDVGLAHLAIRERRWSAAAGRYDEILRLFRDHPSSVDWRLMRASALLELGQLEESEAIVKEISEQTPLQLSPLLLLVRIQGAKGQPEIAWETLLHSRFAEIENQALAELRLDLLIRLDRSDEARVMHAGLVDRASRPDTLESVFAFIPRLFEIPERRRVLTTLLERSEAIQPGLDTTDWVRLQVLIVRIQLALRNTVAGAASLARVIDRTSKDQYIGEHSQMLLRVATVLSDRHYPDYGRQKVFGIGLSRTGTSTLAFALNMLGLHTLHWSNPLTGEIICDDDLTIFDAFTDTPISARFEEFYDQFPHSKFILTVRPFDDWVKSMSALWRRTLGMTEFEELKSALAGPRALRYGSEFCAINRSLYFDYCSYREAYDAHMERVRRFFSNKPADRFLEFNVFAGDGWTKLCAFLGLEAQATPFPWENRASP